MVFPQYPIGLTSTGPDGSVTIDFSQTAADDPNQNDWSKCILTYKIIQGSFLDPRAAVAAQKQQQYLQQAQLSGQQLRGSGSGGAGGLALPGALQAATDGTAPARPAAAALLAGLAAAVALVAF